MVIGILASLVGLIGFAIAGRGSDGVALANAQAEVASLVGAARAQAALHQTSARLVVYAQQPPGGDATKYLRSLVVLREEPAGSNQWVAVGTHVTLPAPICVVPTAPVPATHLRLPSGQNWNNAVATGPVSTFATLAAFSYRGQGGTPAANQFFGTTGSGRVFYLEFDTTGAVTIPATAPAKIALATAILTANAVPQFNNANAVRGLFVRKSGAVSPVNDATSF